MRCRLVPLLTLVFMSIPALPSFAQVPVSRPGAASLPGIEEKTARMTKPDGYFPLYWDDKAGRLWMEISRFDTEVLHSVGYAKGLGSNQTR